MNTSNRKENIWPKAKDYPRSIRLEYSILIAGLIFVIMFVSGYFMINHYVNTITNHVVREIVVQARSFSRSASNYILSSSNPDQLLLNDICSNFANDNPDLYWAGITNIDSLFIAHTDIRCLVKETKSPIFNVSQYFPILNQGELFRQQSDTLFTIIPISEEGLVLGWLITASSNESVTTARQKAIKTMVIIASISIFIGLVITLITLRYKLNPISILVENLKLIDLNSFKINIPVKNKNEIGYLAETLRVMCSRLNIAQNEVIEKNRITHELNTARQIQGNILPKIYPSSNYYKFDGLYRSARELSGDYYDFIDINDTYIAFVVADVSGKSLPGMLVAMLTRDKLRKAAFEESGNPFKTISKLNSEIINDLSEGMFVTLFFGLLNKKTGALQYTSAGHTPGLLLDSKDKSIRTIKTKGTPIGLLPKEEFDERVECQEIQLNNKDMLILYTDGVTEAKNNNSELFGNERLMNAIKEASHNCESNVVSHLISVHHNFVCDEIQSDDITILMLEWTGEMDQDILKSAGKAEYEY